jgi:hypothetical protein
MIHSNQQHIGDTTLHHTLISLTVFVFIKMITVRDVYRIEKNMKYTKNGVVSLDFGSLTTPSLV